MGKSSEEYDSSGNRKVQCRICTGWYHRVDVHVSKPKSKNGHEIAVEEYQSRYPGAPLLSRYAMDEAEELPADAGKIDETQPLKFGSVSFPLRPKKTLDEIDESWLPVHDEQWVMGVSEIKNLEALALGMNDDENVLIVGPPGVGKSTLVRELAVMSNNPLRRLSFNGEMRLSHLVGKEKLMVDAATGQSVTSTSKGPLIDAAERGHWVCFEEFDSAPAHVTFVLHSMLEKPRQLTLNEDDGRQVKFNKRFRVVATANTLGYGDSTGLYVGTAPMNEALLDRFGVVIQVDYPKPDDEVRILMERTKIDAKTAERMVAVANGLRLEQKSEKATSALSPRRLIMWADKAAKLHDTDRAAQLTILNKVRSEDAVVIDGLIQRHFGKKKG